MRVRRVSHPNCLTNEALPVRARQPATHGSLLAAAYNIFNVQRHLTPAERTEPSGRRPCRGVKSSLRVSLTSRRVVRCSIRNVTEPTRSLWAFGEPQKSIRLIAICFSLQILFAGGADGYNNSNGSAMSLNKKRPLAALYFANRIIQRDFPLRAYVAPNVGNPFMGAHSFSSVNALYLHGVRHPNLLTGACYQDCHAFVRYAIAFGKNMTEKMARINAEGRVELIDDRSDVILGGDYYAV